MKSEGGTEQVPRSGRVMLSTATRWQLRHYAAPAIKVRKCPMLNTMVTITQAEIAKGGKKEAALDVRYTAVLRS